jgi:hypothetical protein
MDELSQLDASILKARLSNKYMIIIASLDQINKICVHVEGTGYPVDAVQPLFNDLYNKIMTKARVSGRNRIDGNI